MRLKDVWLGGLALVRGDCVRLGEDGYGWVRLGEAG